MNVRKVTSDSKIKSKPLSGTISTSMPKTSSNKLKTTPNSSVSSSPKPRSYSSPVIITNGTGTSYRRKSVTPKSRRTPSPKIRGSNEKKKEVGVKESVDKEISVSSQKLESIGTEKSDSEEEEDLEGKCTIKELWIISIHIPKEQFRPFARFLLLSEEKMIKIEGNWTDSENADAELIYKMLKEWKKENGKEANSDVLIEALKNIERYDVVDKVYPGKCTDKELLQIATMIQQKEKQDFARSLDISEEITEEIDRNCLLNQYGKEEVLYEIQTTWKEKKKAQATKDLLVEAIKFIGRQDIVNDVFKECRNINYESLRDIQKKIQEHQMKQFKNIQLPKYLWMKDNLVSLENLFINIKIQWEEAEGESINIEEIFDVQDNVIPRRIFIEGPAGHCRTTLLLKFLSDWLNEKSYIKDRFDLVFIIPMKYYTKDLSSHFLRQCEGVHLTNEEKLQTIEAIQGRVLLLLDGLDDIPERVKKNILPILRKEQYPSMTVVATCKTGYFHMKISDVEDFKHMGIMGTKHSIWDKWIKINSISEVNRLDFLQRYFKTDAEKINKKLSDSTIKLKDFNTCPLPLLLLSTVVQERDADLKGTQTELYKNIFNFIINKSLVREQILNNQIDVFNSENEQSVDYHDLLIKIGKLCLEKIKTQNLLFGKSELLSCSSEFGDYEMCIKLGLFVKEILFYNYERQEHFRLIHSSFLEFLAGFYLSTLEDEKFEKEIIHLIYLKMFPSEDHILYPITAGFLQEKAHRLFDVLSYYQDVITIFREEKHFNFETILPEIPMEEEILKSLVSFSLGNFESIEDDSLLIEWGMKLMNYIQKRGNTDEVTFKIPEHLEIIYSLPNNFRINRIMLDIKMTQLPDSIKKKNILLRDKNIRCRNLLIRSVTNADGFPIILKDLILSIKAEKIWLLADNEHSNHKGKSKVDCFDLYTDLLTQKIKLYHLSLREVDLKYFKLFSSQIEELLKNKKIDYGMNISLLSTSRQSKSVTEGLVSFIAHIISKSHLHSVGLKHSFNDPLPLPGPLLDHEQNRKFIGLSGKFCIKNLDKLDCFSVEHFNCIHLSLENREYVPKLLSKCKDIKRISAYSELISDLIDYQITWDGFDTVTRLDVKIDWTYVDEKDSFISGIQLFKNLRELYIVLPCVNHLYTDFFVKLLFSLPSMEKVSVHFDLGEGYMFPKKFAEAVLSEKLETQKVIQITEVEVQGLDIENYSSKDFIEYLELSFHENIIRKFSTLDIVNWDQCSFGRHYFSLNQYKISSEWSEEISILQMFSSGFDEFPKIYRKLTVTYVP